MRDASRRGGLHQLGCHRRVDAVDIVLFGRLRARFRVVLGTYEV